LTDPALPVISNHVQAPLRSTAWSRSDNIAIALIVLLVCGVAISNRSYWIDEAISVYWAKVQSLPDLWRGLRAEGNANLQVPLFYLFAWGWEKLAGPGEIAMRAGNLLWFLIGVAVLSRAFAKERLVCWGILLAVLSSPFAWYYLDEARPYSMQLGASLVVLACLYRLTLLRTETLQGEWLWVTALCLGSVILAASGLIAMMWLGSYIAAAVLSTPKESQVRLLRTHWLLWTITLFVLAGIGCYYLWTLSLGARATTGTMDLKTASFVVYELLGFLGLGPSRLALRSDALTGLRPWLPWLGLYGFVLLLMIIPGWQHIRASISRRACFCWAAAFLAVATFIFAIGVRVGFRVLGRHCTPLLPILLVPIGAGIATWLARKDWIGRSVVLAFLGLSVLSCLNLRFSQRHAKDDYRSAASLASAALAKGETVWWNADRYGALTYGIALREHTAKPHAADLFFDPPEGFARNLAKPDMVVTSKTDIFDRRGGMQDFLAGAGFRPVATLTAFTIWRPASEK
jgi:hypothetical protein